MRIHEFNLVYRQKFDLRFSLVKFDFAGDANDFPCERSDPPVSRNFCPGFNEPSERLIGVISSEVDQYGPEGLVLTETTNPRTSTFLPM